MWEGEARRLLDGLLKLMQFFMNLLLCGHKTGAFKHRNSVCFLIGFCSDPYLWSWILGNDRNNNISGASGRDGFLRRVHGVALRDKVRSYEIRTALNVEPFSCELRDHRYIGSAVCSEWPTRDWRDESCWLKPRKRGSEVIQDLVWVTTYPTLLFSSWCGARRTVRNCGWPWDILKSRLGLHPHDSPQRKRIEINNILRYLLCSLVFKSARLAAEQVPQTARNN